MPRQIASLLLQPEATLEASQALKIPLQTLAGSPPPHTPQAVLPFEREW